MYQKVTVFVKDAVGVLRYRRNRLMLRVLILSFIGASFGLSTSPLAWAQADGELRDAFFVTYFRSAPFSIPNFSTFISMTNTSRLSCKVSIIWRSKDNIDICTTESTIPPNHLHHHCTTIDQLGAFVTTSCQSTCDPELRNNDGYAIIRTAGVCAVRLAVDVTVFSADYITNDQNIIQDTRSFAYRNSRVYRIDSANLVD